jgi:hypothetical protein
MPVLPVSPGGVRVERVVTSGVFELDGGSWEVDNNVWLIGDDTECFVVDAAHEPPPSSRRSAVDGSSRSSAPTATTTTSTRCRDLVRATGATASLHPDDRVLWDQTQPEPPPTWELADGQVFTVGDVELTGAAHAGSRAGCVLPARAGPRRAASPATPSSTAGRGRPGGRSATSRRSSTRSASDLLTLPADTVVLTGHGDATTIGDEAPHLQEWLDRGH